MAEAHLNLFDDEAESWDERRPSIPRRSSRRPRSEDFSSEGGTWSFNFSYPGRLRPNTRWSRSTSEEPFNVKEPLESNDERSDESIHSARSFEKVQGKSDDGSAKVSSEPEIDGNRSRDSTNSATEAQSNTLSQAPSWFSFEDGPQRPRAQEFKTSFESLAPSISTTESLDSRQKLSLSRLLIPKPRSTAHSDPRSTIEKRISLDQQSWHMDPSSPTVRQPPGEWKASTFDTTGLSVEKIHKLKMKGVNPALYAEMRAAKKGSRWINPMVGNTFIG